jgi:BioD-like phosphotransacetylase family protein
MANFPTKAQRFDANLKAEVDTKVLLAAVVAIADPVTATSEDIANKVNEILAALKGA